MGTPKDQLVNPTEPKKKKGLSAEEVARMEREMANRIVLLIICMVDNRLYCESVGERLATVLRCKKCAVRFHFNADEFARMAFHSCNKTFIFDDGDTRANRAKHCAVVVAVRLLAPRPVAGAFCAPVIGASGPSLGVILLHQLLY